jgi:ribosomal-protein-alanine N-acetyltransferase
MRLPPVESQMNFRRIGDEISIDLMDWDHLDDVVRLEEESFSTPWPKISFVLSLNQPEVDALVMAIKGAVVAYLIASEREDEYLIANVAVDRAYRRQGLAKALITKSLELAEARGATHVVLEVRESNEAAIKLYKGLGFRILQKNPGYYSSPAEDALIMTREL